MNTGHSLLGNTLASCLGGITISAEVIASYNAAVRVRDRAFLFGESATSLWLLALWCLCWSGRVRERTEEVREEMSVRELGE